MVTFTVIVADTVLVRLRFALPQFVLRESTQESGSGLGSQDMDNV